MYMEREKLFPFPFPFVQTKAAPPLYPILVPILYVSLLHTKAITYCLSYLGRRMKNPDSYYWSNLKIRP